MVCPNCNWTELKQLSLIYPAGVDESRGQIGGLFLGSADGLLLAKYRGTSQSKLSKMAGSPQKAPYVAPAILWLVGLFCCDGLRGPQKAFLDDGLSFRSLRIVASRIYCWSSSLQLSCSCKEISRMGSEIHMSAVRCKNKRDKPHGFIVPASVYRANRRTS